MDSNDSDIVILREFSDKTSAKDVTKLSSTCQLNDVHCKEGSDDPCCYEDGIDEVPDFDDAELEVLDCWEDEEEIEEGKLLEPKGFESTSSSKESSTANKVSTPEASSSKKYRRTSSCSSDKTVLLKDFTSSGAAKAAASSNTNDSKIGARPSRTSSSRRSFPVSDSGSSKVAKAAESKKSSQKSNDQKDSNYSASKKSTKSGRHDQRPSDLPSDPTETKVDKFLKEIALQHPKIIGLHDDLDDKALEPVSSDSSKHSSQGLASLPSIDTSDLPPGVDARQVCEDASTSHLLVASKGKEVKHSQSSVQASSGNFSSKASSQKSWHGRSKEVSVSVGSKSVGSGNIRSDISKGSEGEKERRSRSPHSKHHYTNYSKRSSRSPPPKVRRVSPAKSFSISPSPSPRSHQLSRSPLLPKPFIPTSLLPNPRIPSLLDYDYSSTTAGPMYGDRHSYQPPLMERNRYHRSQSPPRDTSPSRELSRSLSRERLRWSRSRSRSRSRGRHSAQSRLRHQYSSKDEQHRRYRRSTSRSRSGVQRSRSRSRSRSWSPLHYSRKRSPMRDERGKRLHLPRSRSRSPWKSHVEISGKEWHNNYQDLNRSIPVKDDVQLEHVMERFIQTNMAATGLIPPPAPDVRGWLEQDIKAQETIPVQSLPVIAAPEINVLQGGMPLPPPPPDISELMSGEEIKEAGPLRAMTPEVSLSSLLESAVTGCPDKVIIERCQDAIMKLHDVCIKPGRFAVISSIKIAQTELSSTFRPWQSILNRSSATKIQFNYSKPAEKPVLWELLNSKLSQANQTKNVPSSQKETAPAAPPSLNTSTVTDSVSFNYASDRAVLLDRILCLTRELQNMKQTLNRNSGHKIDAAVQTLPVTLCEACGKNLCSPSSNQLQAESSASSSTSGFWALGSAPHPRQASVKGNPGHFGMTAPKVVSTPKQLPISKAMPSAKQVPATKAAAKQILATKAAAKQVPDAPKQAPVPQKMTTSKQLSIPQPVPVQQQSPRPIPTPAHNSSVSVIAQETKNAIGALNSSSNKPTSGPNQSLVSYLSQQSSSNLTAPSASRKSSPFIGGEKVGVNVPANGSIAHSSNGIPQAAPLSEKTIPPLLGLAPRHVPKQLNTPNPMSKGDYDISKYLMLGDEHMFDLIAHLRSVGVQVKFNAKFCSTDQTVDTIQKNVVGAKLPKQIILMLGLYNNNFNEKLIVRFKHLIGFFRKRCSHLVLIEPPPIPKWGNMKHAWKTFTELKASFGPFQSENVSVVFIGEQLLLNPTTPNPAFYVNNQRLSREGLCIVTEELQKAIADARSKAWI